MELNALTLGVETGGLELMHVPDGSRIVVWVSCGAASAVAAILTLRQYGQSCNVRLVNNPVAEEDDDNQRFLVDLSKFLNHPIETAINPAYASCSASEVWKRRAYMSGVEGAPCTVELKKVARQIWEASNPADFHVLGFTYEERERYRRFIRTERTNVIPVLIDAYYDKPMCAWILKHEGLRLPRIYSLGYPNANCIGCVKATSPTYWNHVRQVHPEVFAARALQSRQIGARLVRVKNQRMFLDELSPDAQGQSMKTLDFECGIFCEEKSL